MVAKLSPFESMLPTPAISPWVLSKDDAPMFLRVTSLPDSAAEPASANKSGEFEF